MRARQLFYFLTVCAVLVLGMFGGGIRTAYAVTNLVWSEEFDGTSFDLSKWTFDIGNGTNGWGNQERQYYTARTNNIYIAGGVLHIVALKESFNGFPYTSARIKTQGLFWKKYGRIEFRAKLPQGLGFWPALWMLGTNFTSVGWPACGEIDVMENKGSIPTQVGVAIHYSDANTNHLFNSQTYTLPGGGSVTNFHTYGLQWATNSMSFYVDSQLVQTWTSWSSATGPYPAPYNQPFFLLMNLAVGGQYLGSPSDATINANTTFPGEMQVDYVRVYDDVPPVTPPDTPTGLAAIPGGSQVSLSWNVSSNATSYNVKRATANGGPYTRIAIPSSTGYTDTGVVNCTTYYYVVSATNSIGESANSGEASATLGSYSIAVNSGGSAASPFIADVNFTGGTVATTASAITTTGATNPAPQAVYQSERWGASTYTFGGLTTGTSYNVRLHFAEIWFGPSNPGGGGANSRKFNVTINGTQVLTNFDVYAASGGQNRAIVKEYSFTSNGSGQIIIAYTVGTADQPKSSGIEIILPPPTAPTGLIATAGETQVALSWNAAPGATGYNVKRATNSGGPYTTVTSGVTSTTYTNTGLANATTYYYVVSTLKTGCESANSVEASATTPIQSFAQWQVQYFGSTTNPAAAAEADAVGTGQNNQFKYVAGLDPTNPASVFVLNIASGTDLPDQIDLLFDPVVAGRTYTPQFSMDLVSGVWTQLTGYAGPVTNASQVTITDLNATQSNKFYRIDISFP